MKYIRKIFLILVSLVIVSISETPCLAIPKELLKLWSGNSYVYLFYGKYGIINEITDSGLNKENRYILIDLDNNKVVDDGNALLDTLKQDSTYVFNSQIDNKVLLPEMTLRCYDFVSGELLWENMGIQNVGLIVKGDENIIYTTQYKSIQSNIIDIVSIDINTGLIQSNISVNVPGKQYDENDKPVLIDCTKEYIFVRINCCEILCIDMIKKNMLWRKTINCERFLQPGEEHIIVNDFFVGIKTVYDCRSDPYIYCLDINTGKELWQVLGTSFASIDDTYLYYYQMYVRDCTKNKQKYIGKIELSTGKIIDRYVIEDDKMSTSFPYHNRYIFHAYKQSNTNGSKTEFCKVMDLSFNTLAVIENEMGNSEKSSINVYGDYLFTYIESQNHLLECICYSLPNYKPTTKTNPPPTNILLWLLNLILRKIYVLP